MLPKGKVSLNDISTARRKSLVLSALAYLKNVQILTPKERMFVDDMLKKSKYRELNNNQIEIIEKLLAKY